MKAELCILDEHEDQWFCYIMYDLWFLSVTIAQLTSLHIIKYTLSFNTLKLFSLNLQFISFLHIIGDIHDVMILIKINSC